MLTRRFLLGSALSSLALPAAGNPDFQTRFTVAVVRRLPPGIADSSLYEFIAPFLENGVPVVFSIAPDEWISCSDEVCSRTWAFLREAEDEYPGFISIVPETGIDPDSSPYFQARRISDLVQMLKLLDRQANTPKTTTGIITALAENGVHGENLSGFRSAGLRNLIVPRTASPEMSPDFESGIHLISGSAFAVSGAPNQPEREFETQNTAANALFLSLMYTDVTRPEDMRLQAESILQASRQKFSDRGVLPTLPSDIHLHLNPEYAQRIVLFAGQNQKAAETLKEMGISFIGDTREPDIFEHAAGTAEQRQAIAGYQDWNLLKFPDPIEANTPHGINQEGQPGLPRRIKVSEADLPDLPQLIGEKSDAVVDLSTLPFRTATRREMNQAISAIAALPTRVIVPGEKLADFFLPDDPVYGAFRDNHLFREHITRQPSLHGGPELSKLTRDAQIAWRYISREDNPQTGLCPTTVFHAGDRNYIHQKATLWDIGSLLFALIAGLHLNFTSEADMIHRAHRIIRAIPTIEVAGLHLPSSLISTRTGQALKQEFNSCDCARLLSAFTHLKQWPELNTIISEKLNDWDLARTIRNNHPHNIDARGFHSTYHSHCTHYSSLAFAEFGMAHDSPYLSQHPMLSDADQKMHLLNRCSYIGLLGAEPLLFEPLEFEATKESNYLADVLLTQHWLHYQKTGQFSAVSEAPVNSSPWFVYEGLNLLNDEDRWDIAIVQKDNQIREDAIRRDFSMVNTKAAFLWSATHPCAYTHELLEHIRRDLPENSTGFPPGIYHRTNAPDAEFTDINTNAVILQAISHMTRR